MLILMRSYWDWTLDWEDPLSSPVFDPMTGFGGDAGGSRPFHLFELPDSDAGRGRVAFTCSCARNPANEDFAVNKTEIRS